MTTIFTVGTTGRDYTTIQAAWDALPSTLADNYRLEIYNDSAFTAGLVASGKTTTATFNVVITAASGQSFQDHASVRSNALIFDATKGVSFSDNPFVTPMFDILNDYVRVERLQLKRSGNSSFYPAVRFDDSKVGGVIKDCIVLKDQTGADAAIFLGAATAINCLFYNTSATVGDAVRNDGNATLINCTLVTSVAGGRGVNSATGTCTLNNCAVFNYTTPTNGTVAGNYNGSSGTITGANSLSSQTFANCFESTSVDFRLKTSSPLIGAGNTDGTNAPNDISATARGASTAGDIGAWEWAAGGGGGSVAHIPAYLQMLRSNQ